MKKSTNDKIKKTIAKAAGKSLYTVADVFSGMLCGGRWYEPKMPEKLKK